MNDHFTHQTVIANGIRQHYVEIGEGPTVLLCHGWPESWYSWRHQLRALAKGGYRVVAPDMRGYGRSSKPQDVGAYTITSLVGDMVSLINSVGGEQAVIIGHDWGAPVAWYSALMRPDLFRAVAGLSVPFRPPVALPPGMRISDMYRALSGERDYYRLFIAEGLEAEAEAECDIRSYLLGLLYSVSGDIGPEQQWDGFMDRGSGIRAALTVPDKLPPWLSEDDLLLYVSEFERTGFTGGFNYYRNIDAITAQLAPFVGRTIEQPSFYLCGEYDLIAGNTPEAHAEMRSNLPDLRGLHVLAGAGHWLQQERADEVNERLIEFLASL
ncbi:alpha/beta fold hydrolase [Sulfitobacter sp. JBTF-M27]|uniref:Alpha/beta fold hydrolase n=1 Tax=Sulfitobacter sediminilitoris TaxID=2698830 RepID=A0A6P0CH84_9RHOB|nr:alpha/beta hydrolase [Sulfitobacter sediminilitoris]NEK24730.1 alpha/beta fold hydrolase [Sulfitobacter sediminilitoris]